MDDRNVPTDHNNNPSDESTETSDVKSSTNKFYSIGELPIPEKITIKQLKQILYDKWNDLTASNSSGCNLLTPSSPDCIRIRDGKVMYLFLNMID
jgi:hypothetical protein